MAPLNQPAHLAEVLESILNVGCECLDDTPDGRPANCFVSHAEPADDCCDLFSVYVEAIRPSQGFSDAQYTTGGRLWDRCCDIGGVADLGLRLVRPCYPGLVDNPNNPFPSPSDIHQASLKLLYDIWQLRCCVMAAACAGDFFPANTNCLEVGWGDIVPYAPEGGCAGWTWLITVELEACC